MSEATEQKLWEANLRLTKENETLTNELNQAVTTEENIRKEIEALKVEVKKKKGVALWLFREMKKYKEARDRLQPVVNAAIAWKEADTVDDILEMSVANMKLDKAVTEYHKDKMVEKLDIDLNHWRKK